MNIFIASHKPAMNENIIPIPIQKETREFNLLKLTREVYKLKQKD
jgi:hypothetical protein